MRYQRAYTHRQRAVTFAGATRTVTIPLEIPDFERPERLATEYNVGNATLCRQIIRQYLKRKARNPTITPSAALGDVTPSRANAINQKPPFRSLALAARQKLSGRLRKANCCAL